MRHIAAVLVAIGFMAQLAACTYVTTNLHRSPVSVDACVVFPTPQH